MDLQVVSPELYLSGSVATPIHLDVYRASSDELVGRHGGGRSTGRGRAQVGGSLDHNAQAAQYASHVHHLKQATGPMANSNLTIGKCQQ
jgi:hypothetical protein